MVAIDDLREAITAYVEAFGWKMLSLALTSRRDSGLVDADVFDAAAVLRGGDA